MSTTYRLLARHGWRKVQPDTKHPKGDPVKQDEFKKNCPKQWLPPTKQNIDRLPIRLMFQDEARFGRMSDPASMLGTCAAAAGKSIWHWFESSATNMLRSARGMAVWTT